MKSVCFSGGLKDYTNNSFQDPVTGSLNNHHMK